MNIINLYNQLDNPNKLIAVRDVYCKCIPMRQRIYQREVDTYLKAFSAELEKKQVIHDADNAWLTVYSGTDESGEDIAAKGFSTIRFTSKLKLKDRGIILPYVLRNNANFEQLVAFLNENVKDLSFKGLYFSIITKLINNIFSFYDNSSWRIDDISTDCKDLDSNCKWIYAYMSHIHGFCKKRHYTFAGVLDEATDILITNEVDEEYYDVIISGPIPTKYIRCYGNAKTIQKLIREPNRLNELISYDDRYDKHTDDVYEYRLETPWGDTYRIYKGKKEYIIHTIAIKKNKVRI